MTMSTAMATEAISIDAALTGLWLKTERQAPQGICRFLLGPKVLWRREAGNALAGWVAQSDTQRELPGGGYLRFNPPYDRKGTGHRAVQTGRLQ